MWCVKKVIAVGGIFILATCMSCSTFFPTEPPPVVKKYEFNFGSGILVHAPEEFDIIDTVTIDGGREMAIAWFRGKPIDFHKVSRESIIEMFGKPDDGDFSDQAIGKYVEGLSYNIAYFGSSKSETAIVIHFLTVGGGLSGATLGPTAELSRTLESERVRLPCTRAEFMRVLGEPKSRFP